MRKHASGFWVPNDDHCWRAHRSRQRTTLDVYVSPPHSAAIVQTDDASRFESPGTVHKKLTFSEFYGNSYETDVSHKFIEYLKLCFRMYIILSSFIYFD